MATESTEKHGKINALMEVFSCPFVDSVAIISIFIHCQKQKTPLEGGA
jgi:hypothetical protein